MWKKMFGGKQEPEDNTQEKIPSQEVDSAMLQVQELLSKSEDALQNARDHKAQISQQIQEYLGKAERLERQAREALKRNNEGEARNYLEEKKLYVQQIEQQQLVHAELEKTVHQLHMKTESMKLKLEHMHTKKNVLSTQLEASSMHDELRTHEENSEQTFESFEEDVILQQSRTEAGGGLDMEFAKLEVQQKSSKDVNTLKDTIEQEEQEKQEALRASQKQRIAQIFGTMETTKQVHEQAPPKATPTQTDQIQEFFKKSNPANPSLKPNPPQPSRDVSQEQQQKIDEFFKTSK